MELDAQIEAILFFKGEAVSIKKLSTILEKSEDEIRAGLKTLEEKLHDRGIRLLSHENEVTLGTAPKVDEIIEKLTKEELSRDLGKAGLETLSIIAYRGPVSRRDIDYIRGVNSAFIVRNLLIRGLIEKVPSEKDERRFLYKPTLELLSYLGIQKVTDLPEFERVQAEISNFQEAGEKDGETENSLEEKGNKIEIKNIQSNS